MTVPTLAQKNWRKTLAVACQSRVLSHLMARSVRIQPGGEAAVGELALPQGQAVGRSACSRGAWDAQEDLAAMSTQQRVAVVLHLTVSSTTRARLRGELLDDASTVQERRLKTEDWARGVSAVYLVAASLG